MPKANDKRCASCRFWHDVDAPSGMRREGECRFNSPMIGADDASGVWPMTFDQDWCGDHEPGLSPSGSERLQHRLRMVKTEVDAEGK